MSSRLGGWSGTHELGLRVESNPTYMLNGVADIMQGVMAACYRNSSIVIGSSCLPRTEGRSPRVQSHVGLHSNRERDRAREEV
jgi:hypothetical protein